MKIVGLTGGTGCGKSTAASFLRKAGGYIIDSDVVGHETIMRGRPAYLEVVNIFGTGILDSCGEIDRKALGNIVFADKAKLDILTKITHEYIKIEIFDIIEQNKYGGYPYIVIDAPLLVEAGLHIQCEKVIAVTADESKRIERLVKRDNKSVEQIKKIMKHQTPAEVLMQKSDYVVDNSGTLKEFEAKINKIVNELKG